MPFVRLWPIATNFSLDLTSAFGAKRTWAGRQSLLPRSKMTRKRHSRYAKVATFFRSIPRQRRGSSDSCLKLIPLRGRAAATLQHGTYLAVPYPGLDSIVPFTA